METISAILKWVFTFLFYPAVVIGIFLYVILTTGTIVKNGGNASAIARRLTGALLPLVILIFVVVTDQSEHNVVAELVGALYPLLAFVLGAIVGLGLMEAGKVLLKTDNEVGPSLYALFLSSVGVFILYSIMIGILGRLHLPLLGLVLAGGLDIIFRGPPTVE
jgi:hypothetical protein